MSVKKVFCYDVSIPDGYRFTDVLMNPEYWVPVDLGVKKVEMFSVQWDAARRTVSGLFVCTQLKDIPPAHIPGDEDFSAVPLENGQGLAYPNAFLYCEQTKVLLLEYNKYGVGTKNILDFFGGNSHRLHHLDWDMGLELILTLDAYQRAERMVTIKEVKVQIATPQNLVRHDTYENGSIEDIARLASELGASRSISMTIKGDYENGGIKKNKILRFMDFFNIVGQHFENTPWNLKNSLEVIGTVNTDEGEVEDHINFFLDRLVGYFELEDQRVHAHLQPITRKSGMEEVYLQLAGSLRQIMGIRT